MWFIIWLILNADGTYAIFEDDVEYWLPMHLVHHVNHNTKVVQREKIKEASYVVAKWDGNKKPRRKTKYFEIIETEWRDYNYEDDMEHEPDLSAIRKVDEA